MADDDSVQANLDSRSRQQKCFLQKGTLKNFAKFTGKHLCLSLL